MPIYANLSHFLLLFETSILIFCCCCCYNIFVFCKIEFVMGVENAVDGSSDRGAPRTQTRGGSLNEGGGGCCSCRGLPIGWGDGREWGGVLFMSFKASFPIICVLNSNSDIKWQRKKDKEDKKETLINLKPLTFQLPRVLALLPPSPPPNEKSIFTLVAHFSQIQLLQNIFNNLAKTFLTHQRPLNRATHIHYYHTSWQSYTPTDSLIPVLNDSLIYHGWQTTLYQS